MAKISLIIPAHNESRLLPRLLDTVDVARERFADGSDAIEVIVADNASTDDADTTNDEIHLQSRRWFEYGHHYSFSQLKTGMPPPLMT